MTQPTKAQQEVLHYLRTNLKYDSFEVNVEQKTALSPEITKLLNKRKKAPYVNVIIRRHDNINTYASTYNALYGMIGARGSIDFTYIHSAIGGKSINKKIYKLSTTKIYFNN